MAEGIILAGGFSSRTNNNKMSLIIKDKPLLIHAIESMRPFVNKIYLVTGHYDQEIRSFIKEDEKLQIVYNKDYPRGMFSSVLCGAHYVSDDFFILPGDIPFINARTYDALLKGSKPVRYPTYKGKEGHPLFIKKELIDELRNERIDSNLKVFRDRQDKEAIEVDDKYILRDVDTNEEYINLKKERE